MDPVSLAAGLIGVPLAVIGTVNLLRKTVQSLENAQPEFLNLVKETELLAGVYDAFIDVLDEDPLSTKGASNIRHDLISYYYTLVEGFEDLHHRVRAVDRSSKNYYSRIERFTARIIWIRSTSTINYLQASLSVARQSIVAFTNIRLIEKLNEELAYLRSALPPAERRRIELKYGMTPDERIEVVRKKVRSRHVHQRKIEKGMEEATGEVAVHQKNIKDQTSIPQTRPLLQLKRSVNQYVAQVAVQEKIDQRARRRYRRGSVFTSESSTTASTQSTLPSHHQTPAPDSPPTSPEQSIAESVIDMQREEEEAVSILNFCQKCSGTYTSTETHNTSIQQSAPDISSCAIQYIPSTAPEPSSTQTSDAKRPSTPPLPQSRPTSQRQSSSSKTIPASRLRPDSDQNHPPKPSVEHTDEDRGTPQIDSTTSEVDEDYPQDGPSEENIPAEAQVTALKSSIWKATGAFKEGVPKGLLERRQRSRSPQDFW